MQSSNNTARLNEVMEQLKRGLAELLLSIELPAKLKAIICLLPNVIITKYII